jgi:YHS domain-containing protein
MTTTFPRLASLLCVGVLLVPLSACKDTPTTASTTAPAEDQRDENRKPDLEGRPVVPNWEAQAGDVTVCPLSGRKFEVEAHFDRYDYQGYTFVFCCADCIDKVRADPAKYLDPFVEEAGGPAEAVDPDGD